MRRIRYVFADAAAHSLFLLSAHYLLLLINLSSRCSSCCDPFHVFCLVYVGYLTILANSIEFLGSVRSACSHHPNKE